VTGVPAGVSNRATAMAREIGRSESETVASINSDRDDGVVAFEVYQGF
jgi:hypothetical protein